MNIESSYLNCRGVVSNNYNYFGVNYVNNYIGVSSMLIAGVIFGYNDNSWDTSNALSVYCSRSGFHYVNMDLTLIGLNSFFLLLRSIIESWGSLCVYSNNLDLSSIYNNNIFNLNLNLLYVASNCPGWITNPNTRYQSISLEESLNYFWPSICLIVNGTENYTFSHEINLLLIPYGLVCDTYNVVFGCESVIPGNAIMEQALEWYSYIMFCMAVLMRNLNINQFLDMINENNLN